jgi:hypothetical protein
VPAIVSVLLHDLVVGDRPATICGRERNPTWIESAIRARFVRDSFHNLNTGLHTGLSRHLRPGRLPCRCDRQPSALPGKCAQRRGGTSAAPARDIRPTGRIARRFAGHRAYCRVPQRTCSEPDRDGNRSRGRAPSGSRRLCGAAFAGPPGSMYLPRCEMLARLRARLEPIGRSPPRRAIGHRDPYELYCACRSVTESIPS